MLHLLPLQGLTALTSLSVSDVSLQLEQLAQLTQLRDLRLWHGPLWHRTWNDVISGSCADRSSGELMHLTELTRLTRLEVVMCRNLTWPKGLTEVGKGCLDPVGGGYTPFPGLNFTFICDEEVSVTSCVAFAQHGIGWSTATICFGIVCLGIAVHGCGTPTVRM